MHYISNQILCFGGWNKEELNNIFVVRVDRINHYLTEFKHSKMILADSFPTNGIYYFEVNGMRVLGRKAVHQFDINTMTCKSKYLVRE